jgi:hypothetical protein
LKNKNEVFNYILNDLEAEKIKIVKDISSHRSYSRDVLNFALDHPYIIICGVIIFGTLTYLYYSAITEYLIKLGNTVNSLIEQQKLYVKTADAILAHEQELKNQITFILNELPKIANNPDKEVIIDSLIKKVELIGSAIKDLSAVALEHSQRVLELEKGQKAIIQILINNSISGTENLC